MPAARSNYPRADKGAVNGLLARMYLNAEVYAGTPMWTEAKSACEAIFGMGYSLCPEYSDLFRGDNGENADALKEIIFGVAYDAEQTQSYGGTSYLTLAAIAATDVTAEQKINGVNNGWAGIRVPYEYVQKYFNARNADYTTGEYTVNDKRGGMFYIKGRQESMNDALYVFLNGWTCLKFNNIPHDMTNDEFLATAASKAYSDIDFPMIRLGEIYLIYAEACMNLGQANTALPKLQELSNRAGVSAPSSVTADYLLEERARELMWEGHRRTDVTAEQKINGVNNGWAGIRVPYEYVQKYFNARNADYTTGEYTVNDKRGGMFYIKGRQESMNDALYVFLNGWTCLKFNNIPHDMTNDEFLATAASKAYSDIDFPMIRLGEIYLIYAEACMNLGQANTALPKLKELTDRAGVSAPSSVTADYLLEERARELMWEGHRRTDLIRYGKFTTPSFLWTYKGGTFTGQGFDDYMKIFAIPSSELASNPELHQNPGYGNATDK